jgi:hypothetical protein
MLSATGYLSAQAELVGLSGTATFTQNGGANFAGASLILANASAGKGLYTLSDGTLLAASEVIGENGIGTFVQSGGTNTVSSVLYLSHSSSAAGTYILGSSGVLSAAAVSSDGTFIQTGGIGSFGNLDSRTAGQGTVMISGGTFSANRIRQSSLSASGNTVVRIRANGTANDPTGTSVVQSLSLASPASTDLANNSMVLDYSGPVGTLVDDVRQHLQSGRLMSSSADDTHRLGYADNALLGLGSFAGQDVDTTSVLIKYTFAGDSNLDGKVDIQDLLALATHYNQVDSAVWMQGDFNYDGAVNGADLSLLASTWQMGVGAPLDQPLDSALAGLSSSVPEPVVTTLLGVFAAAHVLRRRGRK